MTQGTNRTLSRTVILALLTVVTLVFLVSGTFEYFQEKQESYDQLHSELAITADQLAQGLALPLWNVDTDLAMKIAESAMRNRAVSMVRVTSPEMPGAVVSLVRDEQGAPVFGEQTGLPDQFVSQQRDISYGDRRLGRVEVFFTTRYVSEALSLFLFVLGGRILAVNVLLVTSLYLILHRQVTRPLKAVEAYALAVGEGRTPSVNMSGNVFVVEFENLRSVIENMVEELKTRYRELEQSKNALAAAEKRYRNIFENALMGIFQSTPDGRYLTANPAMAEILGYDSPKELITSVTDIGRQVYEDPETRTTFRDLLSRYGEVSGHLIRFKRRDGEIRWGRLYARAMSDAHDTIVIEGTLEDFTERRRAEKELAASEEKFRSIVESSPMAMYFYQLMPDGRLILTGVNPAADDVMGFSHQEFLGRPLEEVFPNLAGTHVPELYRQVARGEIGPQSYQSAYQDERVSAHHDVHVFRTGPDAIVVEILDVTERVRLQEMMIQSEKMASVGGLAAGMAHEINNPLSSILQAAQVSLMQLDPAVPANLTAAEQCGCTLEAVHCYLEKRRVLKFLDGIQEAGKRAAQIVSSMLEFSRKSESRRAAVDINAILDKSVELASTDYDLKKKYDFRHITIVRQYAPGLPEVCCTRTEIEQVLLNLLKNAAQAMAGAPPGEGGPTIALRTARGAGTVRIEVADNGPGMAETVRRRVFEPFFTTKEPGQGTGLGLAVSYFIITSNHGGSIRVESEPGKGARFIIELPIEDQT
jgi:polar amino acid transport system substrate-binding protein